MNRRPSLLVIFLSVFIDLVGFGIVLPLLPEYTREFGAKGIVIGAIYASYSAMQFIFAPIWGRLSDRIGRRPVMLLSNLGAAGSYALFGFGALQTGNAGLLILLASRTFAGIFCANLSVASAYIADVTPPEKRSKGMGLIGMAFGLGFILGPAIGALSIHFMGNAGPGWVGAAICAANFVLGYFILGESRVPGASPAPPRAKFAQMAHTLKQPVVGLLVGIFFLATFCFATFESTFSLVAADQWGLSKVQYSFLFVYCGVIAALVQGGLIGRLVKRFGEARLICFSLVGLAASLTFLPVVHTLTGLFIVLGFFSISSGVNRPPVFGLISINTHADEQGATLGVAQSIGSLARIAAPPFATFFYEFRPALPYFICGGVALLAGLISWQYLCRRSVKDGR